MTDVNRAESAQAQDTAADAVKAVVTEVVAGVLNDEPKKRSDLVKEGKADQRYTDAALEWMIHPDPSIPELCFFAKKNKTRFNEDLELVMESRFKNFGRQLTLDEVKEAVRWFQQKRAQAPIEAAERARLAGMRSDLLRKNTDLRPDVGIVKSFLSEDGKLTVCDRRAEKFQAMVWNNVVIEPVSADPAAGKHAELTATIPVNPDLGKADRRGNFWVANLGKGELKVVPFCRECGDLYKQDLPPGAAEHLRHGYSYEDAVKVAELKSSAIRKAIQREERAKGYAQNAAEVIPGFTDGRDLKRDFRGAQRERGDHRRGGR